MIVTKRDGREVEFDKQKIVDTILRAFDESFDGECDRTEMMNDANGIAEFIGANIEEKTSVEEIQDAVEMGLMGYGWFSVAKDYISYSVRKEMFR